MNKWLGSAITASVATLLVIAVAYFIYDTIRGKPSPTDVQAIRDTLYRMEWDRVQANYTLDASILADVYANDRRGGEISRGMLDLIRYVRQDQTITAKDVGLLDYFQAEIEGSKSAIQKYNAIQEKMKSEGRTRMTPEEAAIITDLNLHGSYLGRMGSKDPAKMHPCEFFFDIVSIHISGETAKVIVNLGEVSEEEIMVKKGGRWYIAGIHSARNQPGNTKYGTRIPCPTQTSFPYPMDSTPYPTQKPYPYPSPRKQYPQAEEPRWMDPYAFREGAQLVYNRPDHGLVPLCPNKYS